MCCKSHVEIVLDEDYDDEDFDIVMILGDDIDIDSLCQDINAFSFAPVVAGDDDDFFY